MGKRFTYWIIGGLILGAVVGYILNNTLPDPKTATVVAGYFSLITDLFLRLIKMIIAPLVISMLIVGIAHMGDLEAIGRIGLKAMAWFFSASLVSLALGLVMVNLLRPGDNLNLPLPDAGTATNLKVSALSLKEFVTHLVPRSIIEAMANNEILQIVVFACFVGTAIAATENRAPAILSLVEQIVTVMLKITGYVMTVAPLVVFAALASTVATQGAAILVTYARFVGGFYIAMLLLWLLLLGVAAIIRRGSLAPLLRAVREPVLLAFSTASSEAAYPKLLENLQTIGLPRQIVSFVLPLGYSFNLDGSMMYCTFATLFIAQAYNIALPIGQQITMLLLLMLTSKGMAGVPRASLVVIAAALPYFNLPESGLLLVLAVDHLLDMGRSATNVIGNSLATAVVAKWEGEVVHVPETAVKPATA